MSERKTSEIKLRVTPSFKAAVQLAAEQAGETMSVYIESASQDRMLQDRTSSFSGTAWRCEKGWTGLSDCPGCGERGPLPTHANKAAALYGSSVLDTPVDPSRFSTSLNPSAAHNQTEFIHTNSDPVPAKDADGSCEKNCHPWEWCECKQLRRD